MERHAVTHKSYGAAVLYFFSQSTHIIATTINQLNDRRFESFLGSYLARQDEPSLLIPSLISLIGRSTAVTAKSLYVPRNSFCDSLYRP